MRLKRYGKDESGAVALMVALLLIVFLGFTALVVDVGYLYSVRRQLQAAADGAALAGCQELIMGGTNAEVLAMARTYAEGDGTNPYNNVAPGDGLTMVMNPPLTVVTSDYVLVTVEKNTPLFFAGILGRSNQMVRAQSVAMRAYLTGVRNLVPWGVPIIQATRVTAKLGSGAEVPLTNSGSTWSGSLSVPSVATGGTGVPVTISAYNDQTLIWASGVPEHVNPAGTVVVYGTGSPITDVHFDRNFIRSDSTTSVDLFVESTGTPKARFDGKNYNLSLVSGNLYKETLTVPNSSNVIDYFPVDVTVGGTTIRDAAVLVVRRSTYPIDNFTIGKTFFSEGGHTVSISVNVNQLTYGQAYDLKVVAGSESGNFGALNFKEIYHDPYYKNPDPSEGLAQGTSDYYYYLNNPYPGVIHIGDVIWTQGANGNLSGPQTQSSLLARFGSDTRTFDQWNADDRPASSRLIMVPVMEKVDILTGASPLRVISFAAFYIEPGSDIKGDNIVGRFVEYISPGEYSTTPPPSGLYLVVPRLVPDFLSF